MLITSLNLDAGFLPVFGARAQISKDQQQKAKKFAAKYLDYLVAHTNEIQMGRVDFAGSFIGLASLLKGSPDDLSRLTNLIDRVGRPGSDRGSAEPGGVEDRSQPVRSKTNRTSSAAGSPH